MLSRSGPVHGRLELIGHIKTHNPESRCGNLSNTYTKPPKSPLFHLSTDSCLQSDNGVSTSNNTIFRQSTSRLDGDRRKKTENWATPATMLEWKTQYQVFNMHERFLWSWVKRYYKYVPGMEQARPTNERVWCTTQLAKLLIVVFQPFSRSYSQLTFFIFFILIYKIWLVGDVCQIHEQFFSDGFTWFRIPHLPRAKEHTSTWYLVTRSGCRRFTSLLYPTRRYPKIERKYQQKCFEEETYTK